MSTYVSSDVLLSTLLVISPLTSPPLTSPVSGFDITTTVFIDDQLDQEEMKDENEGNDGEPEEGW